MSPPATSRNNARVPLKYPKTWLCVCVFLVIGMFASGPYEPISLRLVWVIFALELCALIFWWKTGIKPLAAARKSFVDAVGTKSRMAGAMGIVMAFILALFLGYWLFFINGKYDPGPETCRDTVVLEKFPGGPKHSPDARITSWIEGRDYIGIHLSDNAYRAIKPGDHMNVCSKPGALGSEWITRFDLAATP